MHLAWKLAVLIAIGLGAQVLISRKANDIDEAHFTLRIFLAGACGTEVTDSELLELACDLRDRQMCRAFAARGVSCEATTRPVRCGRDASLELELAVSLAGDDAWPLPHDHIAE